MLTQDENASDISDVARPSTRKTFGRFSARSWRPQTQLALVATASLLSACGTLSTSTNVAPQGEPGFKVVRELRQAGPQGKSAPIFVDRKVPIGGQASAGSESPRQKN
jgi:hypothetical protein